MTNHVQEYDHHKGCPHGGRYAGLPRIGWAKATSHPIFPETGPVVREHRPVTSLGALKPLPVMPERPHVVPVVPPETKVESVDVGGIVDFSLGVAERMAKFYASRGPVRLTVDFCDINPNFVRA